MNAVASSPRERNDDRSDGLGALYLFDEQRLAEELAKASRLAGSVRAAIAIVAAKLVEVIRSDTSATGLIDGFLQEYGLSTREGVVLMRLSEALIRTPDFATARLLIRDKVSQGDWASHAGRSAKFLVNGATNGLRLSAAWIKATGGIEADGLFAKLGDRMLHAAVVRGMGIMAGHFVFGRSIEHAIARSTAQANHGSLMSFDMLGEAAHTSADAERYAKAYLNAAEKLSGPAAASLRDAPNLSIKLSALHPRYEYAKRAACVPELVNIVADIAAIARKNGITITIDAEEADRLETSLLIFAELLTHPALADWNGLGIVVQAYQRRATAVIDHIADLARQTGKRVPVRLVKGAYWDSEIKRAQELGLESYPVFTRKEHTDISYIVCARKLLDAGDCVYPQFATHNAHSMAAVLQMAAGAGADAFEFQRLHGMGAALHTAVFRSHSVQSRIYAPVGVHSDLLPYLVRRLLENGANSSFVNQLTDTRFSVEDIVADPIMDAQAHGFSAHPAIPAPRDLFGGERLSAAGIDFTQSTVAGQTADWLLAQDVPMASSVIGGRAQTNGAQQPVHNPANIGQLIGTYSDATEADVAAAIAQAKAADWPATSTPQHRQDCLMRAADLLERDMPALMRLCVCEAGKSWPDALAEVREAIDFCRYYGVQALSPAMAGRVPLGVAGCISPWNFPLAIFIGQVTAALAAGNTVVAKPAPQTPLIAARAVALLHQAGIPTSALHLVIGGAQVGAALAGAPDIDVIVFTGSTATAKRIASARAAAGRAAAPLIAETGGINAMIIDSTALLEQAVGDVVASAFQSAGQRCSAARLVCVQDDVAGAFEAMLAGSIALLQLGDPADLATDVGPVIDAAAQSRLAGYIDLARMRFRVIGEAHACTAPGHFIRPIAFAVDKIADVSEEIFAPVLHVMRFSAGRMDQLIDDVNALGFGLTMGLHTRIDARVTRISGRAKVGNLYVNRNQIGAVVGVQPFGGEGLSGTGPKAGGPGYMRRLSRCADQGPVADAEWRSDAASVALRGPTGEDNSLRHVPRGMLLAMGGDAPDVVVRQCSKALAMGNIVVATQPSIESAAYLDMLSASEVDKNALTIVDANAAKTLLLGAIDGVIADGSIREAVAATLLQRPGPLLALLSADDDAERYCLERTLTINTTAAGGNASLLAMRTDHLTAQEEQTAV
jgi:RHH-type transcriptional regulator, proline utilization regulon repressor / proline dehydrogenase / delta 1-pyrroline-5-carboxylate dehydrogenase